MDKFHYREILIEQFLFYHNHVILSAGVDREADKKSSLEFARRFRAKSSYRLRGLNVQDDFKWQRAAEQLVLEEHFNKNRSDDTNDDSFAEDYDDDYEQSDDRSNGNDWDR